MFVKLCEYSVVLFLGRYLNKLFIHLSPKCTYENITFIFLYIPHIHYTIIVRSTCLHT